MKTRIRLSVICLTWVFYANFTPEASADEVVTTAMSTTVVEERLEPNSSPVTDLNALTPEEQVAKAPDLSGVDPTPKAEECPLTTVYQEDEYDLNRHELSDPLERANRVVDMLNRKVLYEGLFRPLTLGLKWLMPEYVLTTLGSVFDHAREPVHVINNLLQLQPKRFSLGLVRFAFNTVVGLAGSSDPACAWLEICKMPADFDQTLGFWGVSPGPYLVLPIFGPSSVRGIFGLTGDLAATPMTYVGYYYPDYLRDLSLLALEKIVKLTDRYPDLDLLYNTFEPYIGTKHVFENCQAIKVEEASKR